MQNQTHLLKTRRFLPLFITQFLGAFNDNMYKNAMVILITYVAAEKTGMNATLMVTAAAGIFILPFFAFSAIAGQWADKLEKSGLIRKIKIVEIVIMLIGATGFYLESVSILMATLFLMGTQSAFFGPLKYSILPDHLKEEELIGGNALIETATFLAILIGTLVGGLLVLTDGGLVIVSVLVIILALLGFVSSLFIPKTEPADPSLVVGYNLITETIKIVKNSHQGREVFLSIIGISWFWLVGATYLAEFPVFAKDIIGGDEKIANLFLVAFSIGIGAGSLLCNKLTKGEVSASYVPMGALGITLFTIDLYFASLGVTPPADGTLIGIGSFFSSFTNIRILFDLTMIAVSGGVYIVPLYAIIQTMTEKSHRSRAIASLNVINAGFMVTSAIGTIIMIKSGFTVPEVFLTVGILNFFAFFVVQRLVGDKGKSGFRQVFFRIVLEKLYGVEIHGLENYLAVRDKAMIISNHTSFLDPILLAAFLPDRLTFAVNTFIANKWWVKPFLSMADTYTLDPTNPMAVKALTKIVKGGRKVVIFPEGRLTVTGSLMKIYEGPGMIADKADVMVVPIRIDGAQFTTLSRLKGKVRQRWFPKITITCLPPRKFKVADDLFGRRRRKIIGAQLYDIMTDLMVESTDYKKLLFQSLLDAKATHGGGREIVVDIERVPVTYSKLILGSFVLGKKFAEQTAPGEYAGVLLPNVVATAVTFFGLHAYGRVPAMLNFSTGSKNVISAIKTAEIKRVYTSRAFVGKAGLEEMIEKIEAESVTVVYLEDIKKSITIGDKLYGIISSLFPQYAYDRALKRTKVADIKSPDNPSVVLFTSGSEGTPKGVVLSHANIQANRTQIASRIDFGPTDVAFNALPLFHSFGLTGGTLLPLLAGVKVFFYPSPLHYRIIPELVYDQNATLLFGTDTFLSGYARFANPYDFYSIRYVFAGAEKLKDETKRVFSEKFGVRIFEGYGATETSPVLSINTPMHTKAGSVGRLLPLMNHRLEEVPGIEEGGRLIVSGPNIMKGYFRADKPGVLEPPQDGWYDTGDIVDIDNEGYVTIKGRAKRFAKIAGEMVSLTAAETLVASVWPNNQHAVVSAPDPKKGERLILVTDFEEAKRDAIAEKAKEIGEGDLLVPREIIVVKTVPLLGTGKMDYVGVAELVAEKGKV